MRLGAPILNYSTTEEWLEKVKLKRYKAVYSPINIYSELKNYGSYFEIIKKHDLIIAEFGIWNNPLESDLDKRTKNIEECKKALYLADEIGACCTVNISGSRGDIWDGHDEKNLTLETFDMIVDVVRNIIDDVKPNRTFYTLETMPWMYPDSIESYLKLIKAIDRKSFAVHFDPVNLISNPFNYYNNSVIIKEFVSKLGKYIKSVHLKDITLKNNFMVHLEEVPPGFGRLNYSVLLHELSKLDINLPIMLEHLNSEDEYDIATKFIQKIGSQFLI